MPTVYEIAENARRRNQRDLTPGADLNYQYGPFGAKGQNTAPVGMTQHMIEPDYYIPDDIGAGQTWFANADPTQQFSSFQSAMDYTQGDPELERKVAMYNAEKAIKQKEANRNVALKLLDQQRLRENAMRSMAETRRRDQIKFNQEAWMRRDTDRRRDESSDRTALLSAAQYERDPRKRQQLRNMLSRQGGTSADAARFDALTANRDYYDKKSGDIEQDQQRRQDFGFAAKVLSQGEHTGWNQLNLKPENFNSQQKAMLQTYARQYDRQANAFNAQANQVNQNVINFNDAIYGASAEFNEGNDEFVFDQKKIDDLETAKQKYINAAKEGGYITQDSKEGDIRSAWTEELKPRWNNIFNEYRAGGGGDNWTHSLGPGGGLIPRGSRASRIPGGQYMPPNPLDPGMQQGMQQDQDSYLNEPSDGRPTISQSQAVQRVNEMVRMLIQQGHNPAAAKRMAAAHIYNTYNVRGF